MHTQRPCWPALTAQFGCKCVRRLEGAHALLDLTRITHCLTRHVELKGLFALLGRTRVSVGIHGR